MKIIKEKNFSLIEKFLTDNFSSPTHWPDWNIIVSRFYSTDFFYFCAYENEELIGICPVHKSKKGMLTYYNSGQFHYIPYGGWIFSRPVNFNIYDLPTENLGYFQSFSLPLLPEFKNSSNSQGSHNFKTLVIDLTRDQEAIWNNEIDSKRRNMIRKAEKSGITLNYDLTDINSFYDIYKQSNLRSGLSILPIDFFSELFENSPSIGFLIISASKDGEYLANVVIVYDKNFSIYWLGNNADNTPNLGQGELLQWEAIKSMKDKGCSYYDLCYIEKEKLPQIYKFKSGFSRNEHTVNLIDYRSTGFRIFNKIKSGF